MNKMIQKIIMAIIMLVGLTGCMKMTMNVDVNAKGQVATTVKILASKDLLSTAGTNADAYIEDLKTKLKQSDDVEIEEVTETIDNTEYTGVVAKNAISSSLSTSVNDGTVTLTLPLDQLKSIFKESGVDADSLKSYNLSLSQLKNVGVEMTIVVNMPGEATSNVGVVEGKTVTIDLLELLLAEDESLTTAVISSKIPSNNMIFIIAGVIAAAAIVVAVLLKLKKR